MVERQQEGNAHHSTEMFDNSYNYGHDPLTTMSNEETFLQDFQRFGIY